MNYYIEIDGIKIYTETKKASVNDIVVTRFYRVKEDGGKQYFRCEHNGLNDSFNDRSTESEIDAVIRGYVDIELSAEIKTNLYKEKNMS